MQINETDNTLILNLKALINLLKSLNKLIPYFVTVFASLFFWSVFLIIKYTNLMSAFATIIVFLVSLVVYQSKNYGEAALSLVAGLLTVFSVKWTAGNFVVFVTVWLGFTLFALMFSSVKIAAEVEEIYRQASIKMAAGSDDYKSIEKKLKEISKDSKVKGLGPVEKAEVIRLFCFRKMDFEAIKHGLKAVEVLTVITKVEYKRLSSFVSDIYKVYNFSSDYLYGQVLDWVYTIIRDAPVPPLEFIKAFEETRRIILSEKIDINNYFEILRKGLEKGININKMHDYILSEISN